jgi:hypothetical protein
MRETGDTSYGRGLQAPQLTTGVGALVNRSSGVPV